MVHFLFQLHQREIFSAIVNEYTDWQSANHHPVNIRDQVLHCLKARVSFFKECGIVNAPKHGVVVVYVYVLAMMCPYDAIMCAIFSDGGSLERCPVRGPSGGNWGLSFEPQLQVVVLRLRLPDQEQQLQTGKKQAVECFNGWWQQQHPL